VGEESAGAVLQAARGLLKTGAIAPLAECLAGARVACADPAAIAA